MKINTNAKIKRIIDIKNSVALVVYDNDRMLYTHTDNIEFSLINQYAKEKKKENTTYGK